MKYVSILTSRSYSPYQPFHTDRRISFYLYDADDDITANEHETEFRPWVFGEPISAVRINVSSAAVEDAEPENQGAPLENLISVEGDEDHGQQFVVTTRRKRTKERPAGEGLEGADFFEDDCEVVDFAEDRV